MVRRHAVARAGVDHPEHSDDTTLQDTKENSRDMASPTINKVDASTVQSWLDRSDDVTVLDVRTPAEFETAHIKGSYNVPLHLLNEHAGEVSNRLDRHVVLVCQSGARASQASERLARVGMDNLHVLDGGVPSYAEAGGDVVRGRSRWAMERQVRLVAGSIVASSIAVSTFAPKARFVAGAIGAGLTYSAVTNTCGMARVLSALPYNRAADEPGRDEILARLPGSNAA